jgi:Zn-dependent M28 family amino/carboxypeptidase
MRALLLAGLLLAVAIAASIALITQPFVTALKSQPPAVDVQRLQDHVKRLSIDFYPRSHEQLDKLERAARYIEAEFKSAGAAVTLQDVKVQESTYRNVIARFGPSAGPLLVIGAHYDSHGDASAGARSPRGFTPDTHTPGADDNASGVAGLIELARLLASKPPTRAVELVAYTLEEPPHFRTEHMGSAWHARMLVAADRPVELMVSLEMIGYFSDAPDSQAFPFPGMKYLYSDRGDFIALVGKTSHFGEMRTAKALMAGATDLPVHSINAPPLLPGIDFSDHRSYWAHGMPAMMVTDTAFYRNPHYHRAGDTFDTLDYRRMAKVVQGVYALVHGW